MFIVHIARNALIAMAVILAPVYGLWIFGGWIADRAGQRRTSRILKGPSRAPAK